MTDKGKKLIKKLLDDGLLANENRNDADLISQNQKQEESERDIVEKGEDKSVLPKED